MCEVRESRSRAGAGSIRAARLGMKRTSRWGPGMRRPHPRRPSLAGTSRSAPGRPAVQAGGEGGAGVELQAAHRCAAAFAEQTIASVAQPPHPALPLLTAVALHESASGHESAQLPRAEESVHGTTAAIEDCDGDLWRRRRGRRQRGRRGDGAGWLRAWLRPPHITL